MTAIAEAFTALRRTGPPGGAARIFYWLLLHPAAFLP